MVGPAVAGELKHLGTECEDQEIEKLGGTGSSALPRNMRLVEAEEPGFLNQALESSMFQERSVSLPWGRGLKYRWSAWG